MSIDRYDIKSLEDVYKTSRDLQRITEELESIGNLILKKLQACSTEFTSVNFNRIEAAVNIFIKKMDIGRVELTELSKSCRDFAENIGIIWE